jgi:hypothetical protein
MNRQKLELVAIPVLALVLLLVLWSSLAKVGIFRSKGPPKIAPAAALPEAGSRAIETREEPKKEAPIENLAWGRDPFVLREVSGEGASEIQDLSLMGITWSSDRKAYSAIVNDELVVVGSKVGKFKVVEIGKDRVRVADEKGTYDLNLKK